MEQVEAEVRRLDADAFLEHHAQAHDRWAAALSELWEAKTAAQFTDIRHACREAMQLFVTDLVQQHDPPDVESDPQTTVARLKSRAREGAVARRREGVRMVARRQPPHERG